MTRRPTLDRQVARLSVWAVQAGMPVVRVEAEVGSGMNGARARARRLLADPAAAVIVVEHRDRLGRMNTELVEAALAAPGRRLVVLDDSEVTDDLVRDMIEVLTSFCARLYGRRSARNRALKAVGCAQRDIGPQAVLTSFCARLYGRRLARNRALKAVGCAQRDIGPQAVLKAGSAPRGGTG